MSAAWLKGSLNRAVASSPTLSSAVAKASTAASSVYGFAAPAVSKAVSAVSDRLGARQELTAAVKQLEKLGRDARGPLRVAVLRRWLELLRGEDELPASPKAAPGGDDADVAPPPAALSAAEAKQVFPAPRSAFVDTDGRGTLTFRDVLLRSAALELLANNVLAEPPASAEEASLLRDVFAATLVGGAASAAALVGGLADLTPRLAGYTAEVKASRAELAAVLSAAVAALKTAPAEETARAAAARAAAALADAAAAADAGESASGDAAADTTGAALAAARELDAALQRARSSLAERVQLAPLAASAAALGALGGELGAALAQLKAAGADAARQLADSDAMRGGKLAGADVTMQALAAEVAELSAREAELQAELDRVSTRLAKALLRQAQAREEREAFESGSGDAREALDARRASLADAEAQHAAEAAAVAGWAAFVAAADAQRDTALAAAAEAATAAAASGAAKHTAALAAHVVARARQAGVLVGRLRFCFAELDDASAKAGQMAELGMSVVAADLAATRAKLESQYVEAEEALATLLADAAALRAEAGALASPAGAGAQMESSLAHLAAVAKEFEARTRPRLLREEQAAKLAADAAAAAAAAAHAAAPAPEEEAEAVTVMESVPESPTEPEPAPAAAAPETPPAPAAPAVAEEEDALDTAAVADEPSAEEIVVAQPAATAEA